ncbi:MAG: hypothetical protein LR015_01115 [Verrucomicrobia bacterium]|nr:hypothetical protein [Verrucomicrobiota bacterium]
MIITQMRFGFSELHVYVGRDRQIVIRGSRGWGGRYWREVASADHRLPGGDAGEVTFLREYLETLCKEFGTGTTVHVWLDLWPVQIRSIDEVELTLPGVAGTGSESWRQTLSDGSVYEIRIQSGKWDEVCTLLATSALSVESCLPVQWLLLETASGCSGNADIFFMSALAGYRVFRQWGRWHVRSVPALKRGADDSIDTLRARIIEERQRWSLTNAVLGRADGEPNDWELVIAEGNCNTDGNEWSLCGLLMRSGKVCLHSGARWAGSEQLRLQMSRSRKLALLDKGTKVAVLVLLIANLWLWNALSAIRNHTQEVAGKMVETRLELGQVRSKERALDIKQSLQDRLESARQQERAILDFFWFVHNGSELVADLRVRNWQIPAKVRGHGSEDDALIWTQSGVYEPWLLEMVLGLNDPHANHRSAQRQVAETVGHLNNHLAVGEVELLRVERVTQEGVPFWVRIKNLDWVEL